LAGALTNVGVIRNPRSHANRLRTEAAGERPSGVRLAAPLTPAALARDLRDFAAEGVDLIVIDGGDGTVREVLSALPAAYGEAQPALAVLASGKTNILALDLGARRGWSLEAVLRRAREPSFKFRSPLEISWADGGIPPVRGFVFGLGAFVRATQMSQSVNRMGAYHGVSVALTIAGAAAGAFFGGEKDVWRRGVPVSARMDEETFRTGDRFLLMATTLKRLPFGLRPFGAPDEGMKVLDVEAPPRKLALALPTVLSGRKAAWLERNGYRRRKAERLSVSSQEPIIVDGEVFSGGEIIVRRGPAMRFLAP
jgi:diacylglycerol kinase (ATP)